MTYTVNIIAAKVVQALTEKPVPFGGADSDLRTANGQVFHKSNIIYVNDDGSTLVSTGMSVTLQAKKVLCKDGRWNFILEDGTRASFYADRGADIEVVDNDASESGEEDLEEEEEATPAPKRGKRAPVVEEEDDLDEEAEADGDEDEEDDLPVRGKKAAVAAPKRGKRPALAEEEDDLDEAEAEDDLDEEAEADGDEDEEDDLPVRGKKAAVAAPKRGKQAPVVEEDEDEEPAPKRGAKKAAAKYDFSDF